MKRTPNEAPDGQEESRALDYGVMGIGCLVVLLLLCLATGAGLWLYLRFDVPSAPDSSEASSDDSWGGSNETPSEAGSAPQEDEATRRMRARYRPGPDVRVEGLLPGGMSDLQSLASTQRGGHTLNNPWIIAGAELRPGGAPVSTPNGPGMRHGGSSEALTLIPGTPALLPIVASPAAGPHSGVMGLLLEFPGYEGHFFLPAVVNSELGTVEVTGVEEASVHFGIDVPIGPDGQRAPAEKEMLATVRIASITEDGRISPYITRRLRVEPVGSGDVEVTLTMTQATDLDLYVVDPTGTVIYYGNRQSFTGGHLDLDANAACGSNMGVNAEHVYWSQGRAPAGVYQVRVANFESCIGGGPVDYRISVRNCGETAVFSGRFVGNGDSEDCTSLPSGRPEWCQQVVSFDVTPCEATNP